MSSNRRQAPSGVTCSSLVDALGRIYPHRADITGLVTPSPGRVLFGPAATIAFLPYREDLRDTSRHTFASMFYRATGAHPAGKVLVLANGGYPCISLGGGTKLYRAEQAGLAGVLADGLLRDFHELRDFELATYCRGEATRAGGDTVMPFEADVAVEVAGVTVTPGDYVYADASGAVVIPARDLDRVVEGARAVEAEDEQHRARIRTEQPGDVSRTGVREG